MKYVLFVSFCYKHYKKENYFRIYLDDLLVDEVSLNKDINRVGIEYVIANLEKDSWLRRDLVKKYKLSNGTMPLLTDQLWLYEIDIKEGHTPKIKLDFNITDNNYTNGFMTKSAMVRLEKVGLIPLDKFLKLQTGFWHESWGYYKAKRLRLMEMMKHDVSREGFKYPTIERFDVLERGETKNNSREFNNHWIGKDFTATIESFIKHKTLILKPNGERIKGIVRIDPVFLLMTKHKDVINMYNENQRSNRTKD